VLDRVHPKGDRITLLLVLDGRPVKDISWNQLRDPRPPEEAYTFSSKDNQTDRSRTGGKPSEFIFWTTADLIAYVVDGGGAPEIDLYPDKWLHTVALTEGEVVQGTTRRIKVGKDAGAVYLSPGRTDGQYSLTYSIEPVAVRPEAGLLDKISNSIPPTSGPPVSAQTGNFVADKGECRWICSIDGGGLRGIFALRTLEQLEKYYNKPCFEMFDMFAGTSTGAIIAAMLATGHPLSAVISLYTSPEFRSRIFAPNTEGQRMAARYLDLRGIGASADEINDLNSAPYAAKLIDMVEVNEVPDFVDRVAKILMTPKYSKVGMKELLYQLLSKRNAQTLVPRRLRECGKGRTTKDILIVARDLQRMETTFFTAFHLGTNLLPEDPVIGRVAGIGSKYEPYKITGTYRDVLLKDAVEASASAPVYFSPRGRFSDGGIGVHNNPAFMAAIEALRFSNIDPDNGRRLTRKYLPYAVAAGKKTGTVLWSFGTGYPDPRSDATAEAARLVNGSFALRRRTDTVVYWGGQVLDNLMLGANQEQEFLCREILKDEVKYLRFNLAINTDTMSLLEVPGPGGYEDYISAIGLDSHAQATFSKMDAVAERFAFRAREKEFGFGSGEGYVLTGQVPTPIETYVSQVIQSLRDNE